MNLQRTMLSIGLGVALLVPVMTHADQQVIVPDTWKQVDSFIDTPDFTNPHYRHAHTRVYQFTDKEGQTRHAYVIVCAGGERDDTEEKPTQGDVYHDDQRTESEPEQEQIKSRRRKLQPPDVLQAGDADGAEVEYGFDNDQDDSPTVE